MLNIYSQYTKPEGSIKFDELIMLAKKNKLEAMALTDHGNFSGIIQFYNRAIVQGIKPIIGLDLFFMLNNGKFIRLIFYIRNNKGYNEILKLLPHVKISEEGYSYLQNNIPISLDDLYLTINIYDTDYYSSILDLETDLSYIYEQLRKFTNKRNLFYQLIYDENKKNKAISSRIIEFTKEKNIRPIAINPVYYLNKNDYKIKDLILKFYKNTQRDHSYKYQYLGSQNDFFHSLPEEAIKNRDIIIKGCNLLIEKMATNYPDFKLNREINYAPFDTLKEIILRKFKFFHKMANDNEDFNKLQNLVTEEIKFIESHRLSEYILLLLEIKQEFSEEYKGRIYFTGPVEYFYSSYILGLTISSPLSFKCSCRRTLLEYRKMYPSVGVSLAPANKNKFVQYIENKFGPDKVCLLNEFIKWNATTLINLIGKERELSQQTIDILINAIPRKYRYGTIKSLLRQPELKTLLTGNMLNKEFFRYANLIDGGFKNYGTNTHSLIISHKNIDMVLPVINYITEEGKIRKKSFFDIDTAKFFGVWSIRINSYKAIELLEKVSDEEHFYTEKEISQLADKLISAVKKNQTDSIPFFNFNEKNLKYLSFNKNNPIYNLSLYLESFRINLDEIEDESFSDEVSKSLQKEFRFTGGKLVFFEQLFLAIHKLFPKRRYIRTCRHVLSSKNMAYFRKAASSLEKEEGDDVKVKWLKQQTISSVFYSSMYEQVFKIFLGINLLKVKQNNPRNYYIYNFIESINNRNYNFEKHVGKLKKYGINIVKIELENIEKKAIYNESRAEIKLPLQVVKGISENTANYLYGFIASHDKFSSFREFIELTNKTIVHKHLVEILIKIGFFDLFNNNRKELVKVNALYFNSKMEKETNQQEELFDVSFVELQEDSVQDFSLREKINFEKEYTKLTFSGMSPQELLFFANFLNLESDTYLGYIEEVDEKQSLITFSAREGSEITLKYHDDFEFNLSLPYFLKFTENSKGDKVLDKFLLIANIYKDLNYRLMLSLNSEDTETIKNLLELIEPTGNCNLDIFLADKLTEIETVNKIHLDKISLNKILKILNNYPFYFKIRER